MIENITGYLVLAACLLFLFFVMAALVEPYKERLIRLVRKISWKTARTYFYLWIGILVLRKLLYYIPFSGIIQTPASLWWVDKEVLLPLYTFFIAFLLAAVGMDFAIMYREKSSIWRDFCFEMAFICLTFSVIIFTVTALTSNPLSTIHIILLPALVLKMFCAGKYLGLLVSLGLVYFFLFYYRKLISRIINRRAARYLAGIVLIMISFGVLFYYQLSGDWEKRFRHKVQTAKSERAIEDLLDAVETLTDNKQRIEILKRIAVDAKDAVNIKLNKHASREFIRTVIQSGGSDDGKLKYLKEIFEALVNFKQRDIKAGKEIFQEAIHLARTTKTSAHKSAAVKEIVLTIVKIGEVEAEKELCQQAIDVIHLMHFRARLGLYEEITAVAKTAGKEWAKVIFLQLIDAVETITSNGWYRYDLTRRVLQAVSSRQDMQGETAIFTAAITVANNISYWRNKSLALEAIALAIKKTGDTPWAEAVAEGIPDEGIKKQTLKEIQKK